MLLAPLALPAAGHAQAVLPQGGADVRIGDLRQQFARAFQTQAPTIAPGLTYTPALDVELDWTDSVQPAGGAARKSDFFAVVSPSLLLTGDTPRLTGTLTLAPQLRRYLSTPSQDTASLNFTGQGLLTVVPDLFTVNMSGLAYTQSRAGGFTSATAGGLGRGDQVQTITVTVDPTLRHRFGGTGTATLDYALSQTTITGANGVAPTPFQLPVTNQSLFTRTLHANFTSGEDFGRLGFGADVIRTDNTGTGSLNQAYRRTETVNLNYAVTRAVVLMGVIGHEAMAYKPPSNYRFDGLTWDAKVQLLPNPESSIVLGYGEHQGHDSFSLDATYAPTARLRLTAQYSESVTTGQETARNLLAGAVLNSNGVPVDPVTGLPIGFGSNFFGAQTSPALVRQLTVGVALLRPRDVFNVNFTHQDTHYVSTSIFGVATSVDTSGMTGAVSWQHNFSDDLSGSAAVQYGIRETSGTAAVSQQVVGATLGLNYRLSETLSGRAQYSYNGTIGGSGAGLPSQQQNLITVGLHKSF